MSDGVKWKQLRKRSLMGPNDWVCLQCQEPYEGPGPVDNICTSCHNWCAAQVRLKNNPPKTYKDICAELRIELEKAQTQIVARGIVIDEYYSESIRYKDERDQALERVRVLESKISALEGE